MQREFIIIVPFIDMDTFSVYLALCAGNPSEEIWWFVFDKKNSREADDWDALRNTMQRSRGLFDVSLYL